MDPPRKLLLCDKTLKLQTQSKRTEVHIQSMQVWMTNLMECTITRVY